jgi:hypothetical protein
MRYYVCPDNKTKTNFMRNIYSFIVKVAVTLCCGLVLSAPANAITYTALVSGNYNNSTTWGGAVPSTFMAGDIMIIPSGVTVTLDNDLSIDGTLCLNSGQLVLNNHALIFNTNSNFIFTGTGSITSDAFSDISISSMNNFTCALNFTQGSPIGDLTINAGSANIVLASDLIVNGTLTLGSGTLDLNDNDLTFASGGDFSPAGFGVIIGSPNSDISILAANSFSGALRFSVAANTLNNLILNCPNSNTTFAIGTDLVVGGSLVLSSGKLNVGTHDLTIAATGGLNGGSENSYIILADGGTFTQTSVSNTTDVFPVGTMLYYAPATITAGPASLIADISMGLVNNVMAYGNSGYSLSGIRSLVNNTWVLNSDVQTGLDLSVQLTWNESIEVNNFDRTKAYIAQYSNGWDAVAVSPASSQGSYHSVSRQVTKPGALIVADQNSALAIPETASNESAISMYPNPSVDVIHFSAPLAVTTVDIFDITGRKVKTCSGADNSFSVRELTPGMYSVLLSGKDFSATQKFIKN